MSEEHVYPTTASANLIIEKLVLLADAQQKLLCAYRLGSHPSGKTLDTIGDCRKWLVERGVLKA